MVVVVVVAVVGLRWYGTGSTRYAYVLRGNYVHCRHVVRQSSSDLRHFWSAAWFSQSHMLLHLLLGSYGRW